MDRRTDKNHPIYWVRNCSKESWRSSNPEAKRVVRATYDSTGSSLLLFFQNDIAYISVSVNCKNITTMVTSSLALTAQCSIFCSGSTALGLIGTLQIASKTGCNSQISWPN